MYNTTVYLIFLNVRKLEVWSTNNSNNFKKNFFFQKSINTVPSAIYPSCTIMIYKKVSQKPCRAFLMLFLVFELWSWVSNYTVFFQLWSNFAAQILLNEEKFQKMPDTVFETNVCRLTWHKDYTNTKITFCDILFWKKTYLFV